MLAFSAALCKSEISSGVAPSLSSEVFLVRLPLALAIRNMQPSLQTYIRCRCSAWSTEHSIFVAFLLRFWVARRTSASVVNSPTNVRTTCRVCNLTMSHLNFE
jgi:hypothetical protein